MRLNKIYWVIVFAVFTGCASVSTVPKNISGANSITVLQPGGVGITSDQKRTAQGELISNFTAYSNIAVLDRMNLDDMYAELLSGYYSDDNFGIADLGHMVPTELILSTLITKNAASYTIQAQVSRTSDKIVAASFSESFTQDEFDSLIAVRKVSLALLPQLGVELSAKAKAELSKASTPKQVDSQRDLAKGIEAQRQGTIVEALSYYQSAVSYNPELAEASKRLSVLSANIRTGNIGVDARNAIAARNAWLQVIKQAEEYYAEHLPVEISYVPRLTQANINYQKETVDLQFSVESHVSGNISIMNDILSGLKKTGKKKEWGLEGWPLGYFKGLIITNLEFVLLDENGVVISKKEVRLTNTPRFAQNPNKGLMILTGSLAALTGLSTLSPDKDTQPISTAFGISATLASAIVLTGFYDDNIHKLVIEKNKNTVTFQNVPVSYITDRLTIQALSVNGRRIEQAIRDDYIRITARK
jgi:hypothetical protein